MKTKCVCTFSRLPNNRESTTLPVRTIMRQDQRLFESSMSSRSPSCARSGCCLRSCRIAGNIFGCIVQVQILQGGGIKTEVFQLLDIQAVQYVHHLFAWHEN